MKIPFYKQKDNFDCGTACLRMVTKPNGHNYSFQNSRVLCFTNRRGTTLWILRDAAEKISLRSLRVRVTINELKDIQIWGISDWRQKYYITGGTK